MSAAVERTWYIFRDNQQYGPISNSRLRDLVQEGRLEKDVDVYFQSDNAERQGAR